MANIEEARRSIDRFKVWLNTKSEVAGQIRPGTNINLGAVTADTKLIYGEFNYQQRVEGLPGEPLIFKWTTQPTLAIERTSLNDEGSPVTSTRPLVYSADLGLIGEELTGKVLDRLNALQTRTNGNGVH